MKPIYVILIVVAVIIAILAILYFVGRRLQKKQDEQKAVLDANKQTVSLLVIDKKRMKLKDATLPAAVTEQIPKMSKNLKVPMVKVKIGPQIMTMFCDEAIFDLIPVKKEVKAEISGLYILGVRGVHGTVIKKEEKKKGFFKRAVEKAQEKAGAKPVK
ncbi:MAG: hypothetical protein J6K26_13725 [Lachnospiraceae bacterium]|nr:hypothetical protein [Lachnospiraceae bacterium]